MSLFLKFWMDHIVLLCNTLTAVKFSLSGRVAFMKEPVSAKFILYNLVAKVLAFWCCSCCGVGVEVVSVVFISLVSGVLMSMVSGV